MMGTVFTGASPSEHNIKSSFSIYLHDETLCHRKSHQVKSIFCTLNIVPLYAGRMNMHET